MNPPKTCHGYQVKVVCQDDLTAVARLNGSDTIFVLLLGRIGQAQEQHRQARPQ